jgi:hypothetical protein
VGRRCRILFAVLGLAASSPGMAQQRVTMANGDRLTGKLQRIQDTTWVFNFHGQEVSVPVGQIRAFSAPERIGIRLADTTIVAATVEPAGNGISLILEDGTSRLVRPTDFAAVGSADDLEALEPMVIGLYSPFLKLWKFRGSFGGSLQRGNTHETNLSFSLDLERETLKDRTEFTTFLTTSKEFDAEGLQVKNEPKVIVNLANDIFITPGRLFVGVRMRWQHDPKKELEFRQSFRA